jgi:hypothetical protein
MTDSPVYDFLGNHEQINLSFLQKLQLDPIGFGGVLFDPKGFQIFWAIMIWNHVVNHSPFYYRMDNERTRRVGARLRAILPHRTVLTLTDKFDVSLKGSIRSYMFEFLQNPIGSYRIK